MNLASSIRSVLQEVSFKGRQCRVPPELTMLTHEILKEPGVEAQLFSSRTEGSLFLEITHDLDYASSFMREKLEKVFSSLQLYFDGSERQTFKTQFCGAERFVDVLYSYWNEIQVRVYDEDPYKI